MTTTETKLDALVIEGAPALDPITVVFHDTGPSSGGIIVQCYGKAWSAYWGGMGGKPVRDFIISCDADYLASKLWPRDQKLTLAGEAYLTRIATAIIASLRSKPPSPSSSSSSPTSSSTTE